MRPLLSIVLLLGGCVNPMNAPAMPDRPLTAKERAIIEKTRTKQGLIEKLGRPLDSDEIDIVETTRDSQAAHEMVRWLHVLRLQEFSKPIVAE